MYLPQVMPFFFLTLNNIYLKTFCIEYLDKLLLYTAMLKFRFEKKFVKESLFLGGSITKFILNRIKLHKPIAVLATTSEK